MINDGTILDVAGLSMRQISSLIQDGMIDNSAAVTFHLT
jgi:hypothetical protein